MGRSFERLNAFGQPFTGRRIMGVGAAERRVGQAYSRLSSKERSDYGNQSNFAAEKLAEHEMQMAGQQRQQAMQAAEMGRAKAQASVGPPAPAKRSGMLVPSAGGGSKWMTGEELTAQEEARKKQRKRDPYGYRFRGVPQPQFSTPPPTLMAADNIA